MFVKLLSVRDFFVHGRLGGHDAVAVVVVGTRE